MADTIGNYYVEVRYGGKSAVLLLASTNQWMLRQEDPGFNFAKYAGTRGTFGMPWGSMTQYEFYKEGTTSPAVFKMSGVTFPPQMIMEPRFLDNQFHIGEAWAKGLGYATETAATMANRGHWYAIATGPLMSWVKDYCAQCTEEARQMAITLGINLGALVDPTGVLSLAGAIDASTRGEYGNCALNLLAAIPLIGKVAQVARNTQIAVRLEKLLNEITILNKWFEESKVIIGRTQGLVATGLRAAVTRVASAVPAKAASAVKLLKNANWIHRLNPKDAEALGLLPKEVEALQNLAKQGYYFVVRACNPERVQWLAWAAKSGVRTLSKPLWIKAKSLKEGGLLRGLVGYKIEPGMTPSLLARIVRKVEPPPGFNPRFLERAGVRMTGVFKMEAGALKHGFGIADAGKAADHFLVQTENGFFILVDSKGAAYVSDLDVVLIQKELKSGAYGPPGMNVGGNVPYVGGDNAALRPYWNQQFGKVHYPPGYECIQHGEAGGTAANFKGIKGAYDPAIDVRQTVWSPGASWDSEQLIVVANAEHLPHGVGYANGWNDLNSFHTANPMGEFRIDH